MSYQEIIEGMAKRLNITVEYTADLEASGDDGPSSNIHMRHVWTAPLNGSDDNKNCQAFWATLHEFGHIDLIHHSLRTDTILDGIFGPDPRIPEQEAEAWTWAFDHASGVALNDAARADIQYSLASYLAQGNEPIIGPNLKRVFQEIGPRPILVNWKYDHASDVKRLWTHYAGG